MPGTLEAASPTAFTVLPVVLLVLSIAEPATSPALRPYLLPDRRPASLVAAPACFPIQLAALPALLDPSLTIPLPVSSTALRTLSLCCLTILAWL